MKFQSLFEFRNPDSEFYENEKGVRAIQMTSSTLTEENKSHAPMPPHLLGNGTTKKRWDNYYAPRVERAARGNRLPCLTLFPGHTVPGLGAGENVVSWGSTMIERFEYLTTLRGGCPAIGPLRDDAEKASVLHKEETPPVSWAWNEVEVPKLRILKLEEEKENFGDTERKTLIGWLTREIENLITSENPVAIRKALALVRKAWNPQGKPPVYAPETIASACQVVGYYRAHPRSWDWLALAFELEAALTTLEHSWRLNIHSHGEWNACWLEVGRLPLSKIQCTELVEPGRVLGELVSIRERGFAPIVVNELGCDTDGTHRLVATWLWNMLHVTKKEEWSLVNDSFQKKIGKFIARHRDEMGELVVREALRSLEAWLKDEVKRDLLFANVKPYVHAFEFVTHLPVLLLLEYSCGAVMKDAYDEGKGAYRIDPKVYEELVKDRSCVLPARGPYHLTDRALLPWFEVLTPSE